MVKLRKKTPCNTNPFSYNAVIQAPSRHMRLSAYGCCIPTLTRFTGPIAQDPNNSVIKKSLFVLQEVRVLVYSMKITLVKKRNRKILFLCIFSFNVSFSFL